MRHERTDESTVSDLLFHPSWERMKIKRGPLDKLFSTIIRTRDGWTCQCCHKKYTERSGGLHCAHAFSRRHLGIRWEEDAACALCFGDHQFLDSHAEEKIAFFRARIGDKRYDELYARTKVLFRVDETMVLLRLRSRHKELLNGVSVG